MPWNSRTGTITVSGTITCELHQVNDASNRYSEFPSLISFNVSNATFSLQIDTINYESGSNYEVSAEMSLGCGYTSSLDSDSHTFFFEDTSPVDVTYDTTLTFTIQIPFTEVYEEYNIVTNDSDGFPTYNGMSAKDGPTGKGVRRIYKTRVGQNLTINVSNSYVSCSISHAITSADTINVDSTMSIRADVDDGGSSSIPARNCTVTAVYDFFGESVGTDYDVDDGEFRVDCNGGLLVEVDTTNSGDLYCTGTHSYAPIRRYQLDAEVLAFDSSYASYGTPEFDVRITNGSIITTTDPSYSFTQEKYYCGASFNGSTQTPDSKNEFFPVWVTMNEAWLNSQDEDDRDLRCLLHGMEWDCFELDHDEIGITNTSAINWANIANTTISTGVAIAASGGEGSAQYTPGTPINIESTRYLTVNCKADAAGKSFVLSIGSKSWLIEPTTAFADYEIDLRIPNNGTANSEGKESRFPLDAPGGDPQDSTFWGVSIIDEITIESVEDGVTITIASIDTSVNTFREYTFLSEFTPYRLAWNNGSSDNTYHKKNFISNVDGRFADHPDIFFVDNLITPAASYYTRNSIQTLMDFISETGGWDASAGAVTLPGDGYHDRTLESFNIAGNGMIYDHDLNTRSYYVDKSHTGAVQTIPVQDLWDELDFVGGAGNNWGSTGSFPNPGDDEPVIMAFTKRLRGRGQGIEVEESSFVLGDAVGGTIDLIQSSDSSNRGSDTTDAQGYFSTGIPYGYGNVNHKITLGAESINVFVRNRSSEWAALIFAEEGTIGGINYDISGALTHAVAIPSADTTLKIRYSSNQFPFSFTEIDTGLSVDSVVINYGRDRLLEPLVIWYTIDNTLYYVTSFNQGKDLSMSTTVSSDVLHHDSVIINGIKYCFFVKGSGPYAIYVKAYDSSNNVVITEQSVISGVDDAGISCDGEVGLLNKFKINVFYLVSGALTYQSSVDGVNFS